MVEELRRCFSCGETKPFSDFTRVRGAYYTEECKVCRNKRAKLIRDSAPNAPIGGWTVDTLQDHYDKLGYNLTVIATGTNKDFLGSGISVKNWKSRCAYLINNATGEWLVVPLVKAAIMYHPGSYKASHIETMNKVVKRLREMDKGLGLLSTNGFYKTSNKDGDIAYVESMDSIKEGYTLLFRSIHVHLINHRTGQTGYFPVGSIILGKVPWGSKGYDPESPGVFYLIMIDDMVIKFGVTNNMVDVRYSGEYLDFKKYSTILEVRFEDGTIPQKIERKVSRMVKDHRYNGPQVFRKTKNKECFWYGDGIKLCEVLEYVKSVKDKESGEVVTWENIATLTE